MVRFGGAEGVFREGAPAHGDAREARGFRGLHVEGRVADVGGPLLREVAEELEALQERLGVGLVLGSVLHGDEAVHDVAQTGKVLQGHLHGDAAFGGYHADPYPG